MAPVPFLRGPYQPRLVHRLEDQAVAAVGKGFRQLCPDRGQERRGAFKVFLVRIEPSLVVIMMDVDDDIHIPVQSETGDLADTG